MKTVTLKEFLIKYIQKNKSSNEIDLLSLSNYVQEKYFKKYVNPTLLRELIKEELTILRKDEKPYKVIVSIEDQKELIEKYKYSIENNKNISERIIFEIAKVDCMDGHSFQEYITNLFQNLGYKLIKQQKSRDKGVDIILDKYIAVQVKSSKKGINSSAIQQVYTGLKYYKCSEGWVITNSYFTKDAKELADMNKIKLLDRDKLVSMIYKTIREITKLDK